jgi:hypothetical protein
MNHQPVATVNLKRRPPLSRRLFKYATDGGYKMPERLLCLIQPITLSLSKLSLLKRVTSNDNNGKHMLEEEAESSMVRKRLQLSNDDAGDDDSSDSSEEEMEEEEEEMEEEVSLKETLLNDQLNTSEKLQAKRARSIIFSDDGDTTLPSSELRTPECNIMTICSTITCETLY